MGNALIFCGIKHCGKSTLGRTLARQLGIPFTDTDEMLEKRWQCSCRELFKSIGEEAFRQRETEILSELDPEIFQVISLGGGALLKEENIPILKDLGRFIWCDVDDRTAFERITVGGLPPFLAQADSPFEEFCTRNKSRRATFLAVCDVHFLPLPGLTPEENTEKLRTLLLEKGMIEK